MKEDMKEGGQIDSPFREKTNFKQPSLIRVKRDSSTTDRNSILVKST